MSQELPQIVRDLVERFERNLDSYHAQGYNETQLRREFIDPFFKALGWDVANEDGLAEAYKDVIHEDQIKVGGATKAPDYCFRIGGTRKFFVEAKKPSVSIRDEPGPAYQVRRYAWSAKLPLSILTDFEEFAVYDCRTRPTEKDKPAAGRILYLTYKEYLARWDEIASRFSKDAILKGSFDTYAVSEKKRGTATVDAAFLAEIEDWRDVLAKNLALRNTDLSVHDLNFAVQRTIDRLTFLRICEDRGVEPYGQLQALLNGENIYGRLKHLFEQADDRYNSGLFHFRREKDRAEEPDRLTPHLTVDDKVLKDVIRRLYYPDSPYEFSVFPAEILGQVYEQFLGKVIRLTAGHRAVVEEKPEVKKAGGVYYTPAYIVDYIVQQTVGKLCEGKTPKQIAKLRILDPACGSGSFLIGAYACLLTYHRDWYIKDGPDTYRKEIYRTAAGGWRLTTQEKKRVLLNNIYGVDIDPQAVEVTKLSLLLKVLEGESDETIRRQLSFLKERALPDLGNNIKCGNSLIGPAYFAEQLLPDEDEMRRINPFDWKAEFSEIMKAGGFDAVIGNPPYVRIQVMKEWAPLEVEVYKELYQSASKGNYDIYVVFVEKGLSLLNKNGRLGFILPHKFFQAQYGESLRSLISEGKHLAEVVHFGDRQVFEGATTYTCLLFLDKGGSDSCRFKKVEDLAVWRATGQTVEGSIPTKNITSTEWSFTVGKHAALFEKLSQMQVKLGEVAHLFVGLQTDADDVFILEEVRREGKRVLCASKSTGQQHWFEDEHLKPFLKGSLNIRRYYLADISKRLLFPYETKAGDSVLIRADEYKKRFPLSWTYLEKNRDRLRSRNKGQMGQAWYGYVYKKNHTRFDVPKILVPSIATGSCFASDLEGKYYFVGSGGGGGGGYGITLHKERGFSYQYLLGLLNSRLLNGYLKSITTPFRGGYIALNRQYIQQFPICPINFSDSADKSRHDKMVALVERMLDLHKRLGAVKNPHDQARLQTQIDATDREIDQLVYDLYGLTDEEIAIVEGSSACRGEVKEAMEDEDVGHSAGKLSRGRATAQGVAEKARHAGESRGGPSEGPARASRRVHVIRERTGEYGPPEDPSEGSEETGKRLGSTRDFETAEGTLSYTEVSERLAVALAEILDEILQSLPDEIAITPEWLCLRHQELAGHLFPDWAGRFRDVNVQVGSHTPPPFYEVPVHVRLFCDDLGERLRRVERDRLPPLAELLTWADWRFQWIHPFKDFNGRIGRVLLAALLYKLNLPHVETAPTDSTRRGDYLIALRAADQGASVPLTELWIRRIKESL